MFVNLHTLPAGQHLFTAFVTTDPEGTPRDKVEADEVDIVAPAGSSWGDVINNGKTHNPLPGDNEYAGGHIRDLYGLDSRIVGVVDQSAGAVIFDAFEEGMG